MISRSDLDLYDANPKIPPLTREEEQEAFRRYAESTDDDERERIADQIIRRNMSYAHLVAHETPTVLPLRAARRAAVRGMFEAIRRFDRTRGFKFISYAVWWMRHSIRMEERALPRIALPVMGPGRYARIKRAIENGVPEADAVGREQITMEEWRALVSAVEGLQSLDDDADEGHVTAELIGDDTLLERRHEEETWESSVPAPLLAAALASIPEQERRILIAYFGIGQDSMTLEQIGEHQWLTRERIRQLRDKALRRVRAYLLTYGPADLRREWEEYRERKQCSAATQF